MLLPFGVTLISEFQVLLRWLVQQGVAVLPRSRSVQHILNNRNTA